MTNKEIIKRVAERLETTQKSVKEYADAFEIAFKEMVAEIKSGEKFKCMDMTFSKKDVPEKEGRNPATGEKIRIPATKKVSAKLSKELKELGKK